ncbi:MAG: hypothetical protein A3G75_12405 [Verrucomicrobia bacterium RIFCSPLOWO2_12_FULL_64_8]|nr:MAG: hypothetical protein A3G75_12405 [Verrucomicrobia bacterium RIFCSPLOWO2_12_FULL_64_8]
MWRYLLLFIGVFACSTSVIIIKASTTHALVLNAMRLLLATVLLAPVFWRDWRRHRDAITRGHLRRGLLPGGVLALHFLAWTYGARMTNSAQATLIVNLVPVAMPFFLHFLARERINRAEILGTILAMTGLVVLSARDALEGGGDLWGNIVCFVSMLLFAWYLALGRRNRDFPSVWLYVVPVYLVAGLFSLGMAAPWLGSFAFASAREWSLMLGLAFVPTICGHSALNYSMRRLRGQIVSLGNVAQFVFAGVMAFVLFREAPAAVFYAASALAVAGVVIVILATPSEG